MEKRNEEPGLLQPCSNESCETRDESRGRGGLATPVRWVDYTGLPRVASVYRTVYDGLESPEVILRSWKAIDKPWTDPFQSISRWQHPQPLPPPRSTVATLIRFPDPKREGGYQLLAHRRVRYPSGTGYGTKEHRCNQNPPEAGSDLPPMQAPPDSNVYRSTRSPANELNPRPRPME